MGPSQWSNIHCWWTVTVALFHTAMLLCYITIICCAIAMIVSHISILYSTIKIFSYSITMFISHQNGSVPSFMTILHCLIMGKYTITVVISHITMTCFLITVAHCLTTMILCPTGKAKNKSNVLLFHHKWSQSQCNIKLITERSTVPNNSDLFSHYENLLSQ